VVDIIFLEFADLPDDSDNSDREDGFVLLNNARDPTHGQGLVYLFVMNELDVIYYGFRDITVCEIANESAGLTTSRRKAAPLSCEMASTTSLKNGRVCLYYIYIVMLNCFERSPLN